MGICYYDPEDPLAWLDEDELTVIYRNQARWEADQRDQVQPPIDGQEKETHND